MRILTIASVTATLGLAVGLHLGIALSPDYDDTLNQGAHDLCQEVGGEWLVDGSQQWCQMPDPDAEPTRWCYAEGVNAPWDCYLPSDRPTEQLPVWVGPESQVVTAEANR